jgi:hypothetical protein
LKKLVHGTIGNEKYQCAINIATENSLPMNLKSQLKKDLGPIAVVPGCTCKTGIENIEHREQFDKKRISALYLCKENAKSADHQRKIHPQKI